jgi:AcrR family transcriptional regulator
VDGTVGEMGRADDNKRDKLDRIMRAARSLFQRRGFQGTTMDAVAAEAGVSKGALFFHVGSKAGLVDRIFAADFQTWVEEAFATTAGGHVLDELVDAYRRLLLTMCARPELTRVYMTVVGASDDVFDAMAHLFDATSGLLATAVLRGELVDGIDLHQLSYNLWALYFVEQHRWLLDPPADPDRARDRLTAVFATQLAGFLAAGSARDAAARARPSRDVYGQSVRGPSESPVAAMDEVEISG